MGAGVTQEPDGTVVLGLNGGREVRLRPLTVGENRRLRGLRYEIEKWHRESYADPRSDLLTTVADREATAEARDAARQQIRDLDTGFVDALEVRNLGWLRVLVEIAGGGADLPADDEMPAWLTDTVQLLELQTMLASKPGGSPGRQ